MRSLLFFLLFLCVFNVESQLQFTQIFFRHGQRLPTNYLTFPNEHIDLSAVKDLDQGELTPFGIQQAYTLGQNLRDQYSKLIGDEYKASDLIVYTGQDNRTVASALAVLAGLFPPVDSQVWNPQLRWIPIPVFATEQLDDVSFGILDHCPYYTKRFKNGTADRAIFKRYLPVAESLAIKTGIPIDNLDRLQKVIDGVVSRSFLTNLLPLPKWANDPKYVASMKSLEDQLHSQFIRLLLPETGEWHFDLLISAFDDYIQNSSTHKLMLYSAHDTNMMTMAIYLNISQINETLQPTASYLAFDLIKDYHGDYLIEAFLHNKLNGTREKLVIGSCSEPCFYRKFQTLGSRLSNNDFVSMCKETNTKSELYGGIASVLLILLVLLIAALAATIWSCLTWKKRYEKLLDEEQRPLIPLVHSDNRIVV